MDSRRDIGKIPGLKAVGTNRTIVGEKTAIEEGVCDSLKLYQDTECGKLLLLRKRFLLGMIF